MRCRQRVTALVQHAVPRTAVVVAADDDVLDAKDERVLQAGHRVQVLVVDQATQVAVHKDAAWGQVHRHIRLQQEARVKSSCP